MGGTQYVMITPNLEIILKNCVWTDDDLRLQSFVLNSRSWWSEDSQLET